MIAANVHCQKFVVMYERYQVNLLAQLHTGGRVCNCNSIFIVCSENSPSWNVVLSNDCGSMQIYVKTLMGKKITLDVKPKDMITNTMNKIQDNRDKPLHKAASHLRWKAD